MGPVRFFQQLYEIRPDLSSTGAVMLPVCWLTYNTCWKNWLMYNVK